MNRPTTLPAATTRPDTPVEPHAPELPANAAPALSSQAVLQGRTQVTIEHNGALYRLQSTRQGKLILTK